MAEVLVSPGVLARENDQSFISAQPVQAGAAIVGPTLKGPVGIPTLVTSFSDYKYKWYYVKRLFCKNELVNACKLFCKLDIIFE